MTDFEHWCQCGANWELKGLTMAQIEHMVGLIDRTHKHTLGEVRAKAPAPPKFAPLEADDEA